MNTQEELILVDESDQAVGHLEKQLCHDGEGVLHRAFSIFIFDDAGRVLIHKRSPKKRLWPLFWSNSCCSHPRKGEETTTAAHRRLREELGLEARLRYLYRFQYQATFEGRGSEHELCSVYVGRLEHGAAQSLEPHPDEIVEHRWLTPEALDHLLATSPDSCTPWFRMEWRHICAEFSEVLSCP